MTEKTQPQSQSDTEETEGHGRHFRATEPAPDEPGAEDVPAPDGGRQHFSPAAPDPRRCR